MYRYVTISHVFEITDKLSNNLKIEHVDSFIIVAFDSILYDTFSKFVKGPILLANSASYNITYGACCSRPPVFYFLWCTG
jgi:hypothetical protein